MCSFVGQVHAKYLFSAQKQVWISAPVNTTGGAQLEIYNQSMYDLKMSCTISGNDAAFFSVQQTTFTIGTMNGGGSIPVSFNPTEERTYNAVLTITDGQNSTEVELIGNTDIKSLKPLTYIGWNTLKLDVRGSISYWPGFEIINPNTDNSVTIISNQLLGTSNGVIRLDHSPDSLLPVSIIPRSKFGGMSLGLGLTSLDPGIYKDVLKISYRDANKKDVVLEIPLTLEVIDTTMPPPTDTTTHPKECNDTRLTFDGDSILFGSLNPGNIAFRNCNIINTGNESIKILGIGLQGTNNFQINRYAAYPLILKPNEKTSVEIYFKSGEEVQEKEFKSHLVVTAEGENKTTFCSSVLLKGGVTLDSSQNCITLNGNTWSFGPLDLDMYTEREFQLVNINSKELTLTKIEIDNKNFSLVKGPKLPYTLKSAESTPITIGFSTTKDRKNALLDGTLLVQAENQSHSCEIAPALHGFVIGDGGDTTILSLFPNKIEKINFKTKTDQDSNYGAHTVYLYNGDAKTKVVSVSLKNGSDFSLQIVDPWGKDLPFTLDPYGRMVINIYLAKRSAGTYNDQLIVTTENGLVSATYDLEAKVESATSKVTVVTTPQTVVLNAQPNPSHGRITFSLVGAEHAQLEVYDLLGNIVYFGDGGSNWSWNGNASSGEKLPNGTYVIRAVGHTSNGKDFVTSTRIILAR